MSNETYDHTASPTPARTTMNSSPTSTAIDLNATAIPITKGKGEGQNDFSEGTGAEVKLSQGRKWFLLLIFSVAQYMDVVGYSGLFIFTDQISNDLEIPYLSSSWVLTAYTVTFGSTLLLWGRVSDLYSAKPVFAYGFLGLGVINLIISFMTNRYAYFVFRAVSGIFGAATIPSAFRLIAAIFEPQELQMALALFGLSGGIANVTGLIIAGLFGFITAGGQQAAWRWFFRMLFIVITPFAFLAIALVPKTKGTSADSVQSDREKLKRLDLPGAFLMFAATVVLILGLTLGATYGFKTAKFLVPFLLTWPLLAGFFYLEYKLPEGYALIPPSFWKIPNMTLLIIFAIVIYPYWAIVQLPVVERFLVVFGEKPIIAAVRLLPQGIAALITAGLVPTIMAKIGARATIAGSLILVASSIPLLIYIPNGDIHHNNYWKYYFTAFFYGSGANMVTFLATNITILTSVPAEASGVAGAMLQVALQIGAVFGLSVQAGFLSQRPGTFTNYKNVQDSFWFQFGWTILCIIAFLIFFRPAKVQQAIKAKEEKGEVIPAAV